MALALDVLAVALILGAVAAVKWLRRPVQLPRLSFDEHAATAAALLQPDAPLFTHAEQRQIAAAADTPFADQVQAWLLSRTPTIRPAFPEET